MKLSTFCLRITASIALFIMTGCSINDDAIEKSENPPKGYVFISELFDGYTIEGKDGPTNEKVVFHFCHDIYEYWIGTDKVTYGGIYDSLDHIKIEFYNITNSESMYVLNTAEGSISGAIVEGDLYIIEDIENDPELDFAVTKVYPDDYLCRQGYTP